MDETRMTAIALIGKPSIVPEKSKENFSRALKLLMGIGGVTVHDIAKYLKVSWVYIDRIIKGKVPHSNTTLMGVVEYFQIEPSYFREYRLQRLRGILSIHPELLSLFMRLARNPQKTIEKYKNLLGEGELTGA